MSRGDHAPLMVPAFERRTVERSDSESSGVLRSNGGRSQKNYQTPLGVPTASSSEEGRNREKQVARIRSALLIGAVRIKQVDLATKRRGARPVLRNEIIEDFIRGLLIETLLNKHGHDPLMEIVQHICCTSDRHA